jgi:hypothetical protein
VFGYHKENLERYVEEPLALINRSNIGVDFWFTLESDNFR